MPSSSKASKILFGMVQEVENLLHLIEFEVVLILFNVLQTSSGEFPKVMTFAVAFCENGWQVDRRNIIHIDMLIPSISFHEKCMP